MECTCQKEEGKSNQWCPNKLVGYDLCCYDKIRHDPKYAELARHFRYRYSIDLNYDDLAVMDAEMKNLAEK